jgi:ubiquinone/menaquinone biosynthesis C-methylase UbiE
MDSTTGSKLTRDNQKIWGANPQLFIDRRVEVILDMLPALGPDAQLLDIGCLEGTLTCAYASKIGTSLIHGIDIALPEQARKKGIEVVELDLNSDAPMPYPDGKFDVVTCIETLEHLYPTDHIVAEIHRVLKPGGLAFVDVPRLDSFLNIALLTLGFQPPGIECSRERRFGAINQDSVLTGHVSYFTCRALLEMLRRSGFSIIKVKQVGQRSGWIKLQESQGKKISSLVRLLWWFYDVASWRKEYLVVKVEKKG